MRGLTNHGEKPLTKWDDPPSIERMTGDVYQQKRLVVGLAILYWTKRSR